MNISPLQVLPPQMCLCAVLAGIASFGVAGFAVWGWWLCVVGAAGSLRQPWHPFCLRKCCFIPTNTYRSRSWLDGGDFKLLAACTGGWSIYFISDLSFRLCSFTDLGSTQEHSHPLETRALSPGCCSCIALLSLSPNPCKLIPEYINLASQPDGWWLS